MSTLPVEIPVSDAELVELCRGGNRDAFGTIIARYQSLICAISYNACGNAGRSEELAQDTFVTAWKGLGELNEPAKLKSWLCGIARNLVQNSFRREQHTPTARAEPLPPDLHDDTANPREQAMSHEEESLVWRTLEAIPTEYREPMILFYREGQSAQSVAAALDLTEEAVWQRLSRGRAMLRKGVEQKIESALRRSKPGPAFPAAVMAALPTMATPAKLAALGGAAKSAAALGSAGGWLGSLGWLGLFGLNLRAELHNAKSPRERQLKVRRFWRQLGASIVVVLALGLAALSLPPSSIQSTKEWVRNLDPLAHDIAMAAFIFGFVVTSMVSMAAHDRRRRQIQIEDGTWSEADWTAPETPRNLLTATPGPESNRYRLRLLFAAVTGVVLTVAAIQEAMAGRWVLAAIATVVTVRIPRGIRRMRREPRFGFGFSSKVYGVIWCGFVTLYYYNFRHRAVWTGPVGGFAGVIAFNAGVILVYAVFVWILARKARNRK
jgi:RNA polymerase sigma factor (sigma-70 family)